MKKNKIKSITGFKNSFEALSQLEEFLATPAKEKREQAGVIQAFEFTFEQLWKAIQKAAEDEGLSAASPKQAIKAGLKIGWLSLEDEQTWLDMLSDRNLATHTYRAELAHQIFQKVCSYYFPLLKKTALRMRVE